MTIEDAETFVASLWDWGFLDDCFGETNIRVTDIDGMVERNGHVLILETKLPGTLVKKGQAILFDQLIAKENVHVLVVWGHPGQVERLQFWGRQPFPATTDRLVAIVSRWFRFADGKLDHD